MRNIFQVEKCFWYIFTIDAHNRWNGNKVFAYLCIVLKIGVYTISNQRGAACA